MDIEVPAPIALGRPQLPPVVPRCHAASSFCVARTEFNRSTPWQVMQKYRGHFPGAAEQVNAWVPRTSRELVLLVPPPDSGHTPAGGWLVRCPGCPWTLSTGLMQTLALQHPKVVTQMWDEG